MKLDEYRTFVFDCDGVVLDSNRIKTEAFRQAASPYGEAAADALVAWHVANGGISRYRKFTHFLSEIVPLGAEGPNLDVLLERYAATVRDGLAQCTLAPGLADLRARTSHARWLIVSGGDQAELRQVFADRGIAQMFDGGIFGSPDSKDLILARECASGNIVRPALFLGDSAYDHRAASAAGLGFVFVFGWTEFVNWKDYTNERQVRSVESLGCLVSI